MQECYDFAPLPFMHIGLRHLLYERAGYTIYLDGGCFYFFGTYILEEVSCG